MHDEEQHRYSVPVTWTGNLGEGTSGYRAYGDEASGVMAERADGGGRFTEVMLRPHVVIAPGGDLVRAEARHERAHHLCFIANSVNFPVRCEPQTRVANVIPHSSSHVG
jgi:hypothetical protein